jgi:hypothetical protein
MPRSHLHRQFSSRVVPASQAATASVRLEPRGIQFELGHHF